MSYDDLARRLSNPQQLGLDAELTTKLKVKDESVTRGQLVADVDERGHVGVYFIAAYVIDDTDMFGDGEIYWWSIPLLGDPDGKVYWNARVGLPTGAAPVKCGSNQWFKGVSLATPPLLALVPPTDDAIACLIKFGMYDDDLTKADLPKAMKAGLEALAEIPPYPMAKPEAFFDPIRTAIWNALKATQDDLLLEEDIRLLRNDVSHYSAGMIASMLTERARVYYFMRDEKKTESAAPVTLVKDQAHVLKFSQPIARGGRIAILAKGDVELGTLGKLDLDRPFHNAIVDAALEKQFANGIPITARGDAEVIAYYTAP
jgi:hypothetical protein